MDRDANKKYREIRAALAHRGTTLRRWALASGIPVGSVYSSVRGLRHGPVAVRIRRQIQQHIEEHIHG